MTAQHKMPLYTADDLKYEGITMIVIKPHGSDGEFTLLEYGKGFVPTTLGTILVIPEKYVFQLHKYKIEMDKDWNIELVLKEGETLEELSEFENQDDINEIKNKIIDTREKIQQEQYDSETEAKFE